MQRDDGRSFHAGIAVGDVRYGGRDCKLLIVRDLSESADEAVIGGRAYLTQRLERVA